MSKLLLLPWEEVTEPSLGTPYKEIHILRGVKGKRVAFIVMWPPDEHYHWSLGHPYLGPYGGFTDLEGTGPSIDFCKRVIWRHLQSYDPVIIDPKYAVLV